MNRPYNNIKAIMQCDRCGEHAFGMDQSTAGELILYCLLCQKMGMIIGENWTVQTFHLNTNDVEAVCTKDLSTPLINHGLNN
jgi:hypothetical protein